jgi:hypothetical protein
MPSKPLKNKFQIVQLRGFDLQCFKVYSHLDLQRMLTPGRAPYRLSSVLGAPRLVKASVVGLDGYAALS